MRAATQSSRKFAFLALVGAVGALLGASSALAQTAAAPDTSSRQAVVLEIDGPVTPANAQYLAREIEKASAANKELIVIEIDTPGGLVDSMKTIIKAVLGSQTPVATFVAPQGARSASAGLYIMYAAHISAMAPNTNTGAATPVELGGAPSGENPFEEEKPAPQDDAADEAPATPTAAEDAAPVEESAPAERDAVPALGNEDAMRAKIINDSVAYIRALAEEHGRNADWAEKAVREAASVTSREALELGVIDLIATDLDDLLKQLDGRTVATLAGEKTLETTRHLNPARRADLDRAHSRIHRQSECRRDPDVAGDDRHHHRDVESGLDLSRRRRRPLLIARTLCRCRSFLITGCRSP